LTATIGGQRLFVECCSHRKSFTLELFLEAMLSHVGPDVHLRHDWFLPLSLPHGSSRAEFLHRTLQPLFDEEYIGNLRDRARLRYPVVAGKGNSTLVVYVEGADVDCYDPSVLPQRAGDRDGYVAVILRETLSAKSERNHLRSHRPNLVAVSYLLSAEAQYALSAPSQAPAPVELGDNIDAIALSTIGIDEALSHSSLRLVAARTGEHPARKIAAERL
jgi:hypothetical protein